MWLEPSVEEERLLAETFEETGAAMTRRDHLAEAIVGIAFAVAATALWILQPPHGLSLVPAALCVMVMALATLVRFDTPLGFTVATQAAFVPLLFVVPLALVPIAVVLALAVARVPELLSGQIKPARVGLVVGNSWFALGPVAVFALAGTQPRNAGGFLLLGALVAQFVVDFVASTIRLWIARDADLAAQLRETWVYGIDASLAGIGLVVAEQMSDSPAAAVALVPLLALIAMFAHERHHRLESLLRLNSAYRGTALVLGDVVEADDGYTGEHCKSVVALALAVAERLNLSADQMRNLEFGALLHDVGKIAIPKELINKPGKLDPAEWQIIKTHTIEGQKMLDRVGGFMREVGLIVRSHHERWDGHGYPDGLAGEEIPLESRIISCCDTWNAMRTDRSYRKALSYEVAITELRASTGTQLDPRVVEALIDVIEPEHQPSDRDLPTSELAAEQSAGQSPPTLSLSTD